MKTAGYSLFGELDWKDKVQCNAHFDGPSAAGRVADAEAQCEFYVGARMTPKTFRLSMRESAHVRDHILLPCRAWIISYS